MGSCLNLASIHGKMMGYGYRSFMASPTVENTRSVK
jgi:hypothetical protein